MEAKLPEITLAETICEKLKQIYFHNVPWSECYKQVELKFTKLKLLARKVYGNKTERDMLSELTKYSMEDIKDAINGD